MKRIVSLILILCLMCSFAAEALAAAKWEITQQTKCTTTKKSVTISVKVKGKGVKYQWIFVNPDDPDDTVTGKNLAKDKRFKGIKVSGYTKNKIVLTKVPEALHGWTVYCHLYSNAYKMDTDPVAVAVYGLDEPEQPVKAASDESEGQAETKDEKSEETAASKEKKSDDENGDEEEAAPEPVEFTVTANGKYLFRTDSLGNPEGDEGASSLTFTGSGNVAVKSEDAFRSWTVNGVRFEPEEEISSFRLFNLSSDTSISVKVATKTAASAKVDESVSLHVTCTGCTFTYLPKGLKKATEGEVPSGAVIFVVADSSEAASKGYSINGGEARNPGASSIQVTVTEDTQITVQ